MWRSGWAISVLCSLAVVTACGGSADRPVAPEPAGTATTWSDRAARVSVDVPPGWHVTARPLTGVAMPVQRLVATSFPVRQRRRDRGCGPLSARRQMPADGAMVYVMEYRGPTRGLLARFPPRSRHFRLDPASLGDYKCLGRSYRITFRDHRRALQAHVYLGSHAGAKARRQVLQVLDSLRFGRPSPLAAAVWVRPSQVLSRPPYLGVACPRPNRFACDRVGLAVSLRHASEAVTATVDGRRFPLADPRWSGARRDGRRRMFAGFLRPAGLLHGPLALPADDGPGRWIGRRPVEAGVGLTIRRSGRFYVRTSLVVPLAAGWG
jgi:hypothetical protein